MDLSGLGVFFFRCRRFAVLSGETTFAFETRTGVNAQVWVRLRAWLLCSALAPGSPSVWTDGQEGFVEARRTPLTPPPARGRNNADATLQEPTPYR